MSESWHLAETITEGCALLMYRSDTEKYAWGEIDEEHAGRVVDALNGSTRTAVLREVREAVLKLKPHGVDMNDGLPGRGFGIMLADVMALFEPGGKFGEKP